jgi:hypothetical protein
VDEQRIILAQEQLARLLAQKEQQGGFPGYIDAEIESLRELLSRLTGR